MSGAHYRKGSAGLSPGRTLSCISYSSRTFLRPEDRPALPHRKIQGMTLLEVVLAIAVAGFVLTAALTLLVSVTSIWSDRSERHFFTDHVDGVSEFLNAAFANAGEGITPTTNTNSNPTSPDAQPAIDANAAPATDGSLIGQTDSPIRWERPPSFANYTDPLLNFSMSETPPLMIGREDAPSLGINAFLHFEAEDGLSLLWYSTLQEEVEDTNDLRRTLISPLVKKITYIYWDERFERWEEESEPQKGDGEDQYPLPRFIKLFFEYEDEPKERILTLPVTSKSALIF